MSTGSNNHLFKGGLISKRFSSWLISSKKCAKHYPEHLILRLIELRIVKKLVSEIEPPLASFTSHNFMKNLFCFLSLDKIISQFLQIEKFNQHIKVPPNHYTMIYLFSFCVLFIPLTSYIRQKYHCLNFVVMLFIKFFSIYSWNWL